MKIYSVYDEVMKEFAPPFVAKNDDVAVRNFVTGAKRIPNVNDLQLYCIGRWFPEQDKPVGTIEPYEIAVNFGGEE